MDQAQHILLVDDELELLDTLKDRLEMYGFKVTTTNSGNKAFEIFNNHHIDAIISDIRMPDGDGIELLKNIKASSRCTPVVTFITAHSDLEKKEAYKLGAEGVFEKPFDFSKLRKHIQKLLTPTKERWKSLELPLAPKVILTHDFNKINLDPSPHQLAIGRGGFSIITPSNLPKEGELLSFDFFIHGSTFNVNGYGVLQWKDNLERNDLKICGIEIETLHSDCLNHITYWIEEHKPIAYIPS